MQSEIHTIICGQRRLNSRNKRGIFNLFSWLLSRSSSERYYGRVCRYLQNTFQNQGTPSCLGAASSCLAWPRLALPCHALSCLVLSCLGLNVTLFRQIQKMGFIWWGCFNAFFTLFTIWLITVDNHMGKNIDIFWYFEQKHRFINDIYWWLGT